MSLSTLNYNKSAFDHFKLKLYYKLRERIKRKYGNEAAKLHAKSIWNQLDYMLLDVFDGKLHMDWFEAKWLSLSEQTMQCQQFTEQIPRPTEVGLDVNSNEVSIAPKSEWELLVERNNALSINAKTCTYEEFRKLDLESGRLAFDIVQPTISYGEKSGHALAWIRDLYMRKKYKTTRRAVLNAIQYKCWVRSETGEFVGPFSDLMQAIVINRETGLLHLKTGKHLALGLREAKEQLIMREAMRK